MPDTGPSLSPLPPQAGGGAPELRPETFDAVIAGAGPAGAVAALVLARARWRVALVDQPPSAIKLGEALAPGGRIALERLGLQVLGPPHRKIRGQLTAWDGPDLVATDFMASPHGAGWRLDRPVFDHALREAAIAAGVTAITGLVSAPERDGAHWRLADGLSGRWLVDATGRRATLARSLGARVVRDASQIAYYARWTPDVPPGQDRTLVEASEFGWWYGCELPGGQVLVGLHLDRSMALSRGRDQAAWVEGYQATRHIAPRLGPVGADVEWIAPHDASGTVTRPAVGAGWIAVGDAALAFDPISGHGITHAITSAVAGAEALLGDDAAREGYSQHLASLRQHYAPEWRRVQARRLRPVAAPVSASSD